MTDYTRAFAISASGMALERLRLDVASTNIANANTTRGPDGQVYRPLRVVAHANASALAPRFDSYLDGSGAGVGRVEIRTMDVSPRVMLDPGHPDADAKGFVQMPQINPAEEMIAVMSSVRAYEANVRAMNAAKAMALKALDIGAGR